MMTIIFQDNKYYVEQQYLNIFNYTTQKLNKEEKDFLAKYLYLYYDKKSPYFNYDNNQKNEAINKYEFKNNNFYKILEKIQPIVKTIIDETSTQEERTIQAIKEKIDEIVKAFSEEKIKTDKLEDEPKKVKAIFDLIAIKEKLENNNNNNNKKNRGNVQQSFIENN